MSNNAASTGVASTVYLILIQVVSRGLTFIGNQVLLRYVLPDHLGLAVQLEALSVSVLYTSRESLRVALQRLPRSKSGPTATSSNTQLQGAVNACYLVILVGLSLGLVLGTSYILRAGVELLRAAHFKFAFWLYTLATVIELFSEPGFVVIQQHALFKVRARAETSAAISRCVGACLSAIVMKRLGIPLSVLPFAVGQVCHAASLLVVYLWSASSLATTGKTSIVPRKLTGTSDTIMSIFSRPLLALAGAFYGQSIFKWLLTQGDTLVMSLFASLDAQGIFALASNYGGLVSRLLFQPIEESSRNVFGSLLAHQHAEKSKTSSQQVPPSTITNQCQKALEYLTTMVRAYFLIILMPCTTILPQCFPILIATLLGPTSSWNSPQTVSLLQVYSYYIPTMAINGILDAFVTSTATEAELGAQSIMMLGVTMIYLAAAYFGMEVMQLGAKGLVYANILNMFLRICFSLWFIRSWTRQYLPPRPDEKKSAFATFCDRCVPTYACLFSFLLTIIGLLTEDHVRALFADDARVVGLSQVKVGSVDLDLFHISYLFSAAVVLVSSIVLTERSFLVTSIMAILPRRVKGMVEPYLR